jgi:hypothetical protein
MFSHKTQLENKMGQRKNIIIADDEPECREEFTSRPDLFNVIEVANANNLVDELKKTYALDRLLLR